MKLIIDIDEKEYKTILANAGLYKNISWGSADVWDAILNAIPISTDGDLISREALKKKLQSRYDNGEEDFDKGYNIGIEAAIDLIDNAPTVELKRVKNELNNELNELKPERTQKEIESSECDGKCDSCKLGVPIDGQYYDDGTPIHECGIRPTEQSEQEAKQYALGYQDGFLDAKKMFGGDT